MIFDYCRGGNVSTTYEIKTNDESKQHNNVLKAPYNPNHKCVDTKFHSYSGFGMIFSNFEDCSISDSDDYGGCLTRAIYKIFNPNEIKNYSLRKLILAIRKQTTINSGFGNVEFGVSNHIARFS